ncbi:MAG: hypothetical protein E5V66_14085 [Mesorhizobium sp.]|uniref:hypothetical protein n=1 Tax=Mesorhizobium sp. TaxID=1871066 RepID=UPI00121D6B8B|nr:hypothetical protein [Mesorhizobium sp.]TIU69480.1 MAG: hypothetical protein E5W25_09840 [Mesorhizobium sp.]TIW11290.1 MAG: hypothetical protein E5V66_14085 [Mesorhizobium sp.]
MKRGVTTLLAAFIATSAAADASVAEKRKLYALGTAGAEYCPQITNPWFALGSIGYDMNSDDGEYARYSAEQKNWFETFRKVGSRDVVCEALMQKYGPGADFELFKWK